MGLGRKGGSRVRKRRVLHWAEHVLIEERGSLQVLERKKKKLHKSKGVGELFPLSLGDKIEYFCHTQGGKI